MSSAYWRQFRSFRAAQKVEWRAARLINGINKMNKFIIWRKNVTVYLAVEKGKSEKDEYHVGQTKFKSIWCADSTRGGLVWQKQTIFDQ